MSKQEAEITKEMIEAATDILWVFDREIDDPKVTAVEVFNAMLKAREAPALKITFSIVTRVEPRFIDTTTLGDVIRTQELPPGYGGH